MTTRAALLLALAVAATAACGGAGKPLPSGPAPEYEAPRAYDGGLGDAPPPPAPPR